MSETLVRLVSEAPMDSTDAMKKHILQKINYQME